MSPTDSLVDVFATDSLTRIFQIDFPNTSGDSLALSWRYIDGGWTEAWDVNLCDLGECYSRRAGRRRHARHGASRRRLPQAHRQLPSSRKGMCFLHFWVWPTGNQDALVNIYFDLRNGGVSAVQQPVAEGRQQQWSAYPVPANVGQPIRLTLPPHFNFETPVQLLDINGAFTPCQWDAGDQPALQTASLEKGVYLLIHKDLNPPLRIIME